MLRLNYSELACPLPVELQDLPFAIHCAIVRTTRTAPKCGVNGSLPKQVARATIAVLLYIEVNRLRQGGEQAVEKSGCVVAKVTGSAQGESNLEW